MITYIFSFLITLTIVIVYLVTSQISLSVFLSQLFKAFYLPGTNFSTVGLLNNHNIMLLIYILICIFISYFIALDLLAYKSNIKSYFSDFKKQNLLRIIFSFFVLITILQTSNQIKVSFNQFDYYKETPLSSHHVNAFSDIAYLAKQYRAHLPGKHNSALKTDLNLDIDPGMLYHRVLSYYLYPIDIRGIRGEPKDSLIVFEKSNPLNELTDDWQLLGTIDDKNLVAIRKIK